MAFEKNRLISSHAEKKLQGNKHDEYSFDSSLAKKETLRIEDIHFTHDKVSPLFSCGKDVRALADKLRSNKSMQQPFPALVVMRINGRYWSRNNRRLQCLKLAGREFVQVMMVDSKKANQEELSWFKCDLPHRWFQFDRKTAEFHDYSDCPYCQKRFRSRSELQKHSMKCHGCVQASVEKPQETNSGITMQTLIEDWGSIHMNSTVGVHSEGIREAAANGDPEPDSSKSTNRPFQDKDYMKIPTTFKTYLIGLQGSRIKALEHMHGVKMRIDPEDGIPGYVQAEAGESIIRLVGRAPDMSLTQKDIRVHLENWKAGVREEADAPPPVEKRVDPYDGRSVTLEDIISSYSKGTSKKCRFNKAIARRFKPGIDGSKEECIRLYWDQICQVKVTDERIKHKERPAVISSAIAGATEIRLREVELEAKRSSNAADTEPDPEDRSSGDDSWEATREPAPSPALDPQNGHPPPILGGRLAGPFWLHEYARSPKEFAEAIRESIHLAEIRAALADNSFSLYTKDNVAVLVRSEDYPIVTQTMQHVRLGKRYVIVAEEFEGLLRQALEHIGKGVTVKGRQLLPPAPVKRTFIDVDTPSSMRSNPRSTAVASTTDANPRAKFKPRRA